MVIQIRLFFFVLNQIIIVFAAGFLHNCDDLWLMETKFLLNLNCEWKIISAIGPQSFNVIGWRAIH